VLAGKELDVVFNKLVRSSWVGLFWLNEACTEIVDTAAMVEFTDSDVVAKRSVYPDGMHAEWGPATGPRGRVCVLKGEIVIDVDSRCSDKVIADIKRNFGLKGSVSIVMDDSWKGVI
jgi:hypothetical protein